MKSKLGQLITGATLLLTSSALYSLPASAQRATGNVDVGVSLDVNALVNTVSSAISGQNNRSALLVCHQSFRGSLSPFATPKAKFAGCWIFARLLAVHLVSHFA
ncbi:MAG: hypothetical protein KME23_14075 [Goleter apudmare HA4340-LM2]|jgi:hypothetical protein|nr:hypothetical protein [Goleter apudmare HA4340-LM2]